MFDLVFKNSPKIVHVYLKLRDVHNCEFFEPAAFALYFVLFAHAFSTSDSLLTPDGSMIFYPVEIVLQYQPKILQNFHI